jgi:hypothetical protein
MTKEYQATYLMFKIYIIFFKRQKKIYIYIYIYIWESHIFCAHDSLVGSVKENFSNSVWWKILSKKYLIKDKNSS